MPPILLQTLSGLLAVLFVTSTSFLIHSLEKDLHGRLPEGVFIVYKSWMSVFLQLAISILTKALFIKKIEHHVLSFVMADCLRWYKTHTHKPCKNSLGLSSPKGYVPVLTLLKAITANRSTEVKQTGTHYFIHTPQKP